MTDIAGILAELTAGNIDQAEAQRRIEALRTPDQPTFAGDSSEWAQIPEASADELALDDESEPVTVGRGRQSKASPIDRILVKASGRRVKITPNPSIKTAMAEDIHQTRRRGTTLEISGEVELSGVGNALHFLKSIRGLDDFKALGIGQELAIYVNPDLALDIEVTGGSITVVDVPRLDRVRLTAGVATLTGVEEVGDLVVQAGQATVAGRFQRGHSRLRVESGQLTLRIDPTSEVTVHAEARAGIINWETKAEHSDGELVVHSGAARLDVGVVMGHASIKLDEETVLR